MGSSPSVRQCHQDALGPLGGCDASQPPDSYQASARAGVETLGDARPPHAGMWIKPLTLVHLSGIEPRYAARLAQLMGIGSLSV